MSLQQVIRDYEAALASQDWKRVEPLLHDDVCVTFATGTFKGKAEVRTAFESNFRCIKDERYSIADLHWVYRSDTSAACLYTFHWQGVIDGQSAAGGGRGTSVLVKTNDVWKIIIEHLGPFAR